MQCSVDVLWGDQSQLRLIPLKVRQQTPSCICELVPLISQSSATVVVLFPYNYVVGDSVYP